MRVPYGSPEDLDLAVALSAFKAGRLAEAELGLTKLAGRYPDDDRVVGKLGYVHKQLGHHEAARDLLQRATEIDPGRELWSIGLFHALWALGLTTEAFAEARRYLSLHPASPHSNQLLADMERELQTSAERSDDADKG